MVGGTVIETIVLPDKVWVNCEGDYSLEQCAVYVENTPKARSISNGDTLWWQSSWAFWTPSFHQQGTGKAGRQYDIKLRRIGYSGVARPQTT